MDTEVNHTAHNPPLQAAANPAADECILYSDSWYTGRSVTIKGYGHFNLSNYGLHDEASSWKCGLEVYAFLCDDGTPYHDRCNSDGTTQAGLISNPGAGHRND